MVKGFFTNRAKESRIYTFLESDEEIDEFSKIFLPGNVYDFTISNHVFSLIYLDVDSIVYADYFSETGRGRVSQVDVPIDEDDNFETIGPDAFRIEVMTKEKILTYLHDYINMDIRKEQEFHLGDLRFAQMREDAFIDNFGNDMVPPLGYKVTPIKNPATSPADVLQVCWESLYNTVNGATDIQYFRDLPTTDNMVEAVRRVMFQGMYDTVGRYDEDLINTITDEYMVIANKMIKVIGALDPSNNDILIETGIANTGLQEYFK